MQTFVPYSDHAETARFLDNRRLFKQLIEGKQILLALSDPEYGWQSWVEQWVTVDDQAVTLTFGREVTV